MPRIVNSLSTIAMLTLIVLILLGSQRFPREMGVGDDWLRWDAERQRIYVLTYFHGYLDGTFEACLQVDRLFSPPGGVTDPKDTIVSRCMDTSRNFSKTPDEYIRFVTEYYQRFPEERALPARCILQELYDGRNVSVEDLHKSALEGCPRLAH